MSAQNDCCSTMHHKYRHAKNQRLFLPFCWHMTATADDILCADANELTAETFSSSKKDWIQHRKDVAIIPSCSHICADCFSSRRISETEMNITAKNLQDQYVCNWNSLAESLWYIEIPATLKGSDNLWFIM